MSTRKFILSLTPRLQLLTSALPDASTKLSSYLLQPTSRQTLRKATLSSIFTNARGFASSSAPQTNTDPDASAAADSTRPEEYDDCVFDADDKDYKGEPPSDPEETYLYSPDDDDDER